MLTLSQLTLIVKESKFTETGERFTYQDGIILYEICNKKGGSKEKRIEAVYQDRITPFKEFLLSK